VGATYPSEKYEFVKVSWDDDIPNMGKYKMFQTTNQFLFGFRVNHGEMLITAEQKL
jgi:hypothetical protein